MENKRYIIDNEQLMKEWNFDKNKNVDYKMITCGSNKKVWWKCNKGHEWEAIIYSRVNGRGCPYCSNQKVLKGYNDLSTTFPHLAKEWDYSKNGDLTPDNIIGGLKKVWWICENGHSYEASIDHRKHGSACPICSNRLVKYGVNDLETLFPDIASEWNYEKNVGLNPKDVSAGSGVSAWWKCKKGHEWKTTVVQRTGSKNGCPKCNRNKKVSLPEKTIFYYLKQLFPNCKENYKHPKINGKNFDIFIEELNLAIEYDGRRYHSNIKRDIEKDKLCSINDIDIIRIRELGCPTLDDNSICFYLKKFNDDYEVEKAILFIIDYINKKYYKNITIKIDIPKDRKNVFKIMEYQEEQESLLNKNPEIALEWNYKKNGVLKPNMVSFCSGKKVWWICKKGHEYESSISSRTNGIGCPYCSNKRVLKGYNDLATTHPHLVEEWNYKKNLLLPTEIVSGSNKKIWWICKLGHEWEVAVSYRTSQNTNCPYCTNKKALKDYNDLPTTHSKLIQEWNYKKNIDLNPSDFTFGSSKKVWWICDKGHEWEARIYSRASGIGCPYCSNKKVLKGYNDLATTHPQLLKEWNYEKNKDIYPNNISSGSDKCVWWICKLGHEWKAMVYSRTSGRSCPICSYKERGNKISKTLKNKKKR